MMPQLEGITLTKLLSQNNGHLPESAIKFIATQIVLALSDLHRKGIMYRILSTDSVFVESDGFIKLHNFEHARRLADTECAVGNPPGSTE